MTRTLKQPSIRVESALREAYGLTCGRLTPQAAAKRFGVSVPMARKIIAWHQARRNSPHPETFYGEREVPAGQTVRCPECRAKLTIWIPGHVVRGCRACRIKKGL
jgi:hypothetical protein